MAKKLKMKTKRGAAKRFRVTASGKYMRGHSGKRHLLGTKPSKRTRRLRKSAAVNPADVPSVRRMLPYSR
ncbi:MAG TPA: 50S ribosomal protein L35 [Candidatus Acidoferrales bacterium]|nr:50S ribosomal protein L35 [Candidatus Acidoferrales bacterium]